MRRVWADESGVSGALDLTLAVGLIMLPLAILAAADAPTVLKTDPQCPCPVLQDGPYPLLGQAIGEVILFRIATEINEGQNGDGFFGWA